MVRRYARDQLREHGPAGPPRVAAVHVLASVLRVGLHYLGVPGSGGHGLCAVTALAQHWPMSVPALRTHRSALDGVILHSSFIIATTHALLLQRKVHVAYGCSM